MSDPTLAVIQIIEGLRNGDMSALDRLADMTEAYGDARAAQERERWLPLAREFVQKWDDGVVFDSAVLRKFARAFRLLLDS